MVIFLQYLNEKSGQKKLDEAQCAEQRELGALDKTISQEKIAEFQSWKEYDEALPMFCDVDGQ